MVEICVTRVSSALRETRHIDVASPNIVSLLQSCLRHHLLLADKNGVNEETEDIGGGGGVDRRGSRTSSTPSSPSASSARSAGGGGGRGAQSPHAKIASDIIACVSVNPFADEAIAQV